MGKIITVVGNLGAGKTTLARMLCDKGSFIPYWEKPEERPFQGEFTKDLRRWAFTNQMDFLMFRSQQEVIARKNDPMAIMDGGLDQDFHVFTKNLYHKGYLIPDEFNICERFYNFARTILPPPDIVVRIVVDATTLLQRRSFRERRTVDQLFDPQEFTDLEILLEDWLRFEKVSPVIQFPFEKGIQDYTNEIEQLMLQITRMLTRG